MRATNFMIFVSLPILLQCVAAQNETQHLSPTPSPPKRGFSFGPRMKLNPSMAIILVCLISAFFVMGCISVYVRQCAERGLADDLFDDEPHGSRRRTRRAALLGLDPTIIDTFPIFLYSHVKGLKLGKGALECAVCLNEFEDSETLRLLPRCSHVFHPDCIDAWLASHVTCPVCRANLIPKAGELGDSDSLSHRLEDELHDPVPSQEVSDSTSEICNPAVAIDIQNCSTEATYLSEATNQTRPSRSTSKRQRIEAKIHRSRSTGHLLIQPGEDCERFTLRLPEEARSHLMQSELTRTQSCVAFPRARSATKGYRSNSGGLGRSNPFIYERFRSERRGLFPRTESTRSQPKEHVNREEITAAGSRNLLRSVKTPFDRLFGGTEKDNNPEDRLIG